MEIYEGKKQLQQQSSKSSRSPSPESPVDTSPEQDESYRPVLRTPPPSRAGPPPSPPVPTNPVAPVAPEASAPLPLMPCLVCGRTFVPQSLAKHAKICEKMTVKKRKTFDSSRQRREGTDLEQYLPKNFGLPENSPFLEKSPPATAKPTPKTKPHSVRSAIMKPTAELQKCPHCARAFGVRAFERHVEWCADKAKILPAAPAHAPPHITDAKQRLNARTQYKAPPVRARKSSQTREKSSNSRSASVDSSRGVSPPPPREYGDYKQGRARASESMSSNDCHEDTSPHVPVIRNSRNSQNNSSGDANVKARQARLARDLSSSRKTQDPHPSSVQQSRTDPNIKQIEPHNKPKTRINVKKQQQLKKLEALAQKYNEEKKENSKENSNTKVKREKSLIPVAKKVVEKCELENSNNDQICRTNLLKKENKDSKMTTVKDTNKKLLLKATSKISLNVKTIDKTKTEKKVIVKKHVNPIRIAKETSMSLDSLEESPLSASSNKNSPIDTFNTEPLCVPCILHNTAEDKHIKKSKRKGNKKCSQVKNSNVSEPQVELLYKNPTAVDSCDIHITECYEKCSEENLLISNLRSPLESSISSKLTADGNKSYLYIENSELKTESENAKKIKNEPDTTSNKDNPKTDTDMEDLNHLSVEKIEENYEHDLSEEIFDNSSENLFDVDENENSIEQRSGETYTKFTENPADLEEFMSMTDKLMDVEDHEHKKDVEHDVINFHTPNTNSLETINNCPDTNVEGSAEKTHKFSHDFEELKNNLKDLLGNADDNTIHRLNIETSNEHNINREVSDMEHITVYELKFYEENSNKVNYLKDSSGERNNSYELKLPSITQSNKVESKAPKNRKMINKIYQHTRKNRGLNVESRTNREYQTFIVKQCADSDNQSISSEAPPLKLPRIENKRLDDNYDPFESAARQMKELMSAETNAPKLQNSSKDSRTLPILRPTKDKMTTSYLGANNTKMMKDTLNKTYQKTPTLQRMKSFGSSNNESNSNAFGGRCSSFRINRNDKKSSPKLNTTFTKSSKENISTSEKSSFTRNSNLNRSFSSYNASSYSTPKMKDKMPKIATSMYHSFQRSTVSQPVKLDKINRDDKKKDFVNLDAILADDNSSMTDSNYIDPRLINENDNLPINVNTILNNPDIISSMESLLTTENLPAKFESFSTSLCNNNKLNGLTKSNTKLEKIETNNNLNKTLSLPIDEISSQYDKIMTSLEQSIASKTSVRDDDSLCEDFDLEEFMTSFDEEIHKHKSENKRTCSSTTRVVKHSDFAQSNRTSELSSVCSSPKLLNGMIPVNKSMSLNFSSNNIVSDNLFPSSVKRSTSLLDSIQKKNVQKTEYAKGRNKTEQLEQDIMQSLKDFDKFYESEKNDNCHSSKDAVNHSSKIINNSAKRDTLAKLERKPKKKDTISNGNYTPNGKSSNDSAYSSLNRISPAKLTVCNKEPNGFTPIEKGPVGSDTGSSHKEDNRSISSEEFLAMERSAELDEPSPKTEQHSNFKELENHALNEKHSSSRASSRRSSTWKAAGELSSSGSEASLQVRAPPRLSRFCHECGNKFPVDTAKFCIQCGVKRLAV